ncbi:hypothetical protein PoB_002515800 [Plakobranchus ocellatus]|uniref:Uncharacterized protein n=1 Tax=Plakobranchus ocellatus TaxID=259542 RepID=A0AAV3ZW44_9GAST|nr:hypothetical protein PoB_002515800 [Plakobranchus ocellatus]
MPATKSHFGLQTVSLRLTSQCFWSYRRKSRLPLIKRRSFQSHFADNFTCPHPNVCSEALIHEQKIIQLNSTSNPFAKRKNLKKKTIEKMKTKEQYPSKDMTLL